MLALAGIGAQFAGLYAWSRARSGVAPGPLFVIGLALLAASVAAFVSGSGVALGISRAFLSVSLVAYVLLVPRLLTARQIGTPVARSRKSRTKAARGGKLGLALRLIAAGPLYLAASLSVSAVLATKLPWEEVNRLMMGGFVVPAVWALGALHATADLRLLRVLGAPIVVFTVFAGLYLAL